MGAVLAIGARGKYGGCLGPGVSLMCHTNLL
jgi:hypothetical protein